MDIIGFLFSAIVWGWQWKIRKVDLGYDFDFYIFGHSQQAISCVKVFFWYYYKKILWILSSWVLNFFPLNTGYFHLTIFD